MALRVGGEGLGRHHVGRNRHRGAARLHGLDDGLGLAHQAGFGQALADRQAGGEQEGVGDAAANDQAVDLGRQALQDRQLGADLGAGDDGHERALRTGQRFRDGIDLGREQRAGAGQLGELGDAVGAGLGAVRGAEGVVNEDVAQRGHLLGQRRVVLLLAHVHAAVLEQHHLARRDVHAGQMFGSMAQGKNFRGVSPENADADLGQDFFGRCRSQTGCTGTDRIENDRCALCGRFFPAVSIDSTQSSVRVPMFNTSAPAKETISSTSLMAWAMTGEAPMASSALAV